MHNRFGVCYKRFFLALTLLPLLLLGLSLPAWAGSYTMRIVVFGDSLTSGYQLAKEHAFPTRLEAKLKQAGWDVEVVNASVSGETTAGGLQRVDSIVKMSPDLVILELGANDGLRGLDTKVMQENLRQILLALKKHTTVLFAGMKAPANLGAEYVASYDAAFRSQSGHAYYYPFFLEGVAGVPNLNLADGVHPNAEGVSVIVEGIYPHVDKMLRHLLHYKGQPAQ